DETALVGDLDLNDDVILQGAGPGLTVLDGTALSDRILTANADLELRDLTLTGGSAPGFGCALLVDIVSTVLLERVEVLGNHATAAGGAIFALGDTTLQDVLVAGNVGGGTGGGIAMRVDALLMITDSRIEGNSLEAGQGAGIHLGDTSTMILIRSSVEGNRIGSFAPLDLGTGNEGGGIFIDSEAGGSIQRSSVLGNVAQGPASFGGGVRTLGEALVLESTVAWNEAEAGAGVSAGDGAVVFAINSTISLNRDPAPLTAAFAIEAGASALLRAVTVKALPGDVALAAVGGTMVVEDSALDGTCVFLAGATVTSIGGNVAAPAACWTVSGPDLEDEVVPDLALGNLGNFGGGTLTHLPGPGTPLVGHALGACTDFDQRGLPRTDCDSGAVERQAGDPDPIFVDTFESADLSAWSQVIGPD
ncbi:MAG: right-handed parallel beta-helix repeat-containing protein, partial [Acidobacteria bacterium]|nr:right-handed parallel beta-helix repeat-containing protein [Acidobacteriota bacterium]